MQSPREVFPPSSSRRNLGHAALKESKAYHMGILLLVIVLLLAVGGLPNWRYSRDWGYAPASGLGLVLVVLLILVMLGYIPRSF